MPQLRGRPISVSFQPSLTAHRGKLLSGSTKGTAVNAGSFLLERRIVLEDQLKRTPIELARIFVHEVFHFAWWRLGNPARKSYEDLLLDELDRGARGELGWSAQRLKERLSVTDRELRTPQWRLYVCESFCDTGGWAFGSKGRYAEMTLAKRWRQRRLQWVKDVLGDGPLTI